MMIGGLVNTMAHEDSSLPTMFNWMSDWIMI
jgi:hypothetical protein